MAHDTRDVLLATGTTLFLERGYAATGLQDILQHSRIPKGSFYHHFQSKEGFGLELLERFAAAGLAELDAALGDASVPTHLGRLRRYFECAGNHAAGEGCCRGGCLMGTLGQELANVNEPIRERVEALFRRWQGRIEACLRRGRDAGELPADADVGRLAEYTLLAWQGALQQMRIRRSDAPVAAFLDGTFGRLLPAPAAAVSPPRRRARP